MHADHDITYLIKLRLSSLPSGLRLYLLRLVESARLIQKHSMNFPSYHFVNATCIAPVSVNVSVFLVHL